MEAPINGDVLITKQLQNNRARQTAIGESDEGSRYPKRKQKMIANVRPKKLMVNTTMKRRK